jgi:hypothetical protein
MNNSYTNFPNGVTSFGVPLFGNTQSAPVGGTYWFVDTVNGSDGNTGTSPSDARATLGSILDGGSLGSFDTIYVSGKLREQLEAPVGVYGVTIVGNCTTPNHDNSASWTLPASGATAEAPLILLREQGWVIANMVMYGTTDSAAVELKRREDATDPDPSHAQFVNVRFVSNFIGIEDNGGCFNVKITGCTFQSNTDAIKNTSTTIANPLMWSITGSNFIGNTNAITSPASKWSIKGNNIVETTTTVIDFTGGIAPNVVNQNVFDIAAANFDPAGGVTGVTGDAWSNTLTDVIETGLPAN